MGYEKVVRHLLVGGWAKLLAQLTHQLRCRNPHPNQHFLVVSGCQKEPTKPVMILIVVKKHHLKVL